VLLGVGSIASRRIGQLAEPLSQGASVLFLKFGRDAERESDRLGVEYSSKIGYDASQMADFFLTLQRQEQQAGGGSVPGFLSTHPNSADRYKTVTQLAAQQKQQLGNARLSVNRDQYLRLLEGLPYGEDPRQGFVEGNVFYHPDLKFRFPVPSGWKHQNSPQQFQIAEPSGKALMILLTAPGKSLDEAAQALAQQLKLQSPQAQKTTINSFPAVAIQGNQVGQDQQTGQQAVSASTLSYIIQDGNTMYAFVGLSAPQSFSTYSAEFNRIAQGFQRLTDASKLNRQPERVRVKTAKTSTTLAQALAASGVPSSRRDEMAILNGMQLNDRLSAGMMYKVVGK
jgi:predicted Zn-dependent protease